MKTVGDIVYRVSSLLADQGEGKPYQRWSKDFHLASMTEALGVLYQNRPDTFSTTKQITLSPGSKQSLDGEELVKISTSEDEQVSEDDADDKFDLGAILASKACSKASSSDTSSGTATIRTFKIDPNDSSTFYVEPEVPAGSVAEVEAVVLTDPPCLGLGDWGSNFPVHVCHIAPIVEFMLYRAYSVDAEDQTMLQMARSHYRNFFDIVGKSYRQQSRFESGWYLGQEGDGDNQAGRR